MSTLAIVLAMSALFVAVALLSTGVVALLGRLGVWAWTLRSVSPALRAGVAAAPLCVATMVCAAVVSASRGGCHCHHHALHHPHLCLAHPEFALPLLGVASTGLALWALWVTPRLLTVLRAVVASQRWTQRARSVTPHFVDGIEVRVIECSTRSAFTIGALFPVIVCDKALWTALSEEHRRALAQHEAAHAVRRDGLTLLLLRVGAALFPFPWAERLLADWSRAAEHLCDRHAAATLGDGALVAEALVAVERARLVAASSEEQRLATAMPVLSAGSVEQRVLALLSQPVGDSRSSDLANDALAVALVGLALVVATWFLPGDAIHHGIETLAGLLSHHP